MVVDRDPDQVDKFLHPALAAPAQARPHSETSEPEAGIWGSRMPAVCSVSFMARTGFAIAAMVLPLLGVDMVAVQRDKVAWGAGDGIGAAPSLRKALEDAGVDPAHSALVDAARSWLLVTKGGAAAGAELDPEPELRYDDSVSVTPAEAMRSMFTRWSQTELAAQPQL